MSTLTLATLYKTLRRKQREHVALLARIERTAARLDRRKRKLGALESTIADLEGRITGPNRGRSAKDGTGPGLRRAQLIFNPSSGHNHEDDARRLSRIVSSLRDHGIEAAIGLRTSGKAGRTLARDAARNGCPLVIVAAGDGTIGDVAAQLIGTSTVLGLVPIGTLNNVARSLGIPLAIDDACALIGGGTARPIDAGRVRTNPGSHDEYFLECAGVGLSAIGALGGQAFEKRRWRVVPKGLQRLFGAGSGTMRVELDGTVIEASTRIVTVSNAPLMADNLLAAPGARMDDGFLDVSVYEGMGDDALVRHFRAASSHTPDDLKIYRARRVTLTPEGIAPPNGDRTTAPAHGVVEIAVVPAALSIIVGDGIGLTMAAGSAASAPASIRIPSNGNGSAPDGALHPAPVRPWTSTGP